MKRHTTYFFLTNLFFWNFLFCVPLFSQDSNELNQTNEPEILLEEDFSTPGIPLGWTTEDGANNNVIWGWCSDPTSPPSAVCPGTWDGPPNNQISFAATTASNGFLNINSDFFGDNHISRLTTMPFDFSNETAVWLRFETHIGAFNNNPNTSAVLRVSIDGGFTWELFKCFPDFVFNEFDSSTRWSENPTTSYIDISSVAANQVSVLLQWQWIGGDEFYWAIDDLFIYAEDPRPSSNLILEEDWFAIAPNVMTPRSQITPFGFTANITNNGSQAQENVKLGINITNQNNNTLVFTDTLNYGTVEINGFIEDQLFPELFTPTSSDVTYNAKYTLWSDSMDLVPEDNTQSFSFIVSDSTFAKETGISSSTTPQNFEWDPGELHSWAWGNHFYIPNGSGYEATSSTFAIANPEVLTGKFLFLVLYKWEDVNNNAAAEVNERQLVGFHNYQITNNTPGGELINVPLQNLSGSPIALEDDTNYLLMLEYQASSTQNLFINYHNKLNYGAAMFRSAADERPQYMGMAAVNHPLTDVAYEAAGFGPDRVPVIRLHIDQKTSIHPTLPNLNKIVLFPNPIVDDLHVDLQLERKHTQIKIQVLTIKGRLVQEKILTNIQTQTIPFHLKGLAAGTYLLQVNTTDGNRTIRFVK